MSEEPRKREWKEVVLILDGIHIALLIAKAEMPTPDYNDFRARTFTFFEGMTGWSEEEIDRQLDKRLSGVFE